MKNEKAIIYSDSNLRWIEDLSDREAIIAYMHKYCDADIHRERLKIRDLPVCERETAGQALTQIELRRRYARKFPEALSCPEFLFPSPLAAEQATDEAVARLHAAIARECMESHEDGMLRALDMTAGLGMDAMSLARSGVEVTAIEADPLKATALRHNAGALRLHYLTPLHGDSVEWLKSATGSVTPMDGMTASAPFDLIFADPARRGEGNARIYNPADCLPDIVGLQPLLLPLCRRLIVKHSPMLDITEATRIFHRLSHIYIISLRGECKEVLTVQSGAGEPMPAMTGIVCLDIKADDTEERFTCRADDCGGNPTDIAYAVPAEDIIAGHYLYQPHAGVMKAAPWRALRMAYPGIRKIAADTHLFVSGTLYADFPGRIVRIESIVDKKNKAALKGQPYNVICRNYFMKSSELERQLRTVAGDDRYIYAFRTAKGAMMLTGVKCRV